MPLRVRARERRSDSENGRAFNLNGVRVKDIKDPTGVTIGTNNLPSFSFVGTGEYVAMWNTTGLSTAGYYEVEIEATVGYDTVAGVGTTIRKDVTVLLMREGAP